MSSDHAASEQQHLAAWQSSLQELIDQGLSAADTVQMQAHLSSCMTCSNEHRRLLAIDAQLRNAISTLAAPSAEFEQRLIADIAALEHDKRAKARQRELQEYGRRLAQVRGGWQELMRFQVGNIIAGLATASAVIAALVTAWPTMSGTRFIDAQLARLPFAWVSPLLAVSLTSLAIAAVAFWITGTQRRR